MPDPAPRADPGIPGRPRAPVRHAPALLLAGARSLLRSPGLVVLAAAAMAGSVALHLAAWWAGHPAGSTMAALVREGGAAQALHGAMPLLGALSGAGALGLGVPWMGVMLAQHLLLVAMAAVVAATLQLRARDPAQPIAWWVLRRRAAPIAAWAVVLTLASLALAGWAALMTGGDAATGLLAPGDAVKAGLTRVAPHVLPMALLAAAPGLAWAAATLLVGPSLGAGPADAPTLRRGLAAVTRGWPAAVELMTLGALAGLVAVVAIAWPSPLMASGPFEWRIREYAGWLLAAAIGLAILHSLLLAAAVQGFMDTQGTAPAAAPGRATAPHPATGAMPAAEGTPTFRVVRKGPAAPAPNTRAESPR